MQRTILMCAVSACFLSGCSSQLSHKQASAAIDAALERHASPALLKPASAGVPGLEIDEEGECSVDTFRLGRQPALSRDDGASLLYAALEHTGYLAIHTVVPEQHGGRATGSDDVVVEMLPRAGVPQQSGKEIVYPAGFRCFETIPGDTRCLMPALLVKHPEGFKVRQVHVGRDGVAEVGVRIPWELTPLGQELREYIETQPDRAYAPYWERSLRGHTVSGSSPATVYLRKSAMGWEVVNPSGKTDLQMADR